MREPLPLASQEQLQMTCAQEHAHCFACRSASRGGLDLRFSVDAAGHVLADWTGSASGQSYPGILHGGMIATLLDSAMVHALFARGIVARTGELRLRYRHPVRTDIPVRLSAGVESSHPPLFRMSASLVQEGVLCVQAEAKFMAQAPVSLRSAEG